MWLFQKFLHLLPHQLFCNAIDLWHSPIDLGWLWKPKWLHVQDKLDYLCTLNSGITIGHVGGGILAIPIDNCQMCRWHIPHLKRIVCCTFFMNFIGFYSIFHWTWAIINNATQVINTSCSPKNQSIIIFQVGGFNYTTRVFIMFPIHTLRLFYYGPYGFCGRSSNNTFPSNLWGKRATRIMLNVSKFMFLIPLWHPDAFFIFCKTQWHYKFGDWSI